MNKKIILVSLSCLILFTVASVSAQVQLTNPLSASNFSQLLTQISTAVAGLVGTLSGIMIIISGILYLISAGDPQKTNTAKAALKYAIIGVVVAILAIPIVEVIKQIIGAGGSTP